MITSANSNLQLYEKEANNLFYFNFEEVRRKQETSMLCD